MKKRILRILMMTVMLSLMVPAYFNVHAAKSGSCGANVTWNLDNSGTLTISGSGPMYNYGSFDDSPWEENDVRKVVISGSVTSIGENTFDEHKNLESVTMGNSVEYIQAYAFEECSSLSSITFSNKLLKIGYCSFFNCIQLESINLPSTITEIGYGAFVNCGLTEVYIPGSSTMMNSSAFSNCTSLQSINVAPSNQNYTSVDGIVYSKDKKTLVKYPAGRMEASYSISDNITTIGADAFGGCLNIRNVQIPDSVTCISSGAFRECASIEEIVIPDSVTELGYMAFIDCSNLSKITILGTITDLRDNVFDDTAYYNNPDNWDDDVLYIANHLITAKTSITGVYEIKAGTKVIASDAFYRFEGLTGIIIPDSVIKLGPYAFQYCENLKSAVIGNGVKVIEYACFSDCSSLENVSMGTGIELIDAAAFRRCSSLKSIIIPEGVTEILNNAFYRCTELTSVKLPGSISVIRGDAFEDCDSLCIYYNGTEEKRNEIEGINQWELNRADWHYFAYVTIVDQEGNQISKKEQEMGDLVNISGIYVPENNTLLLYKDRDLTQVYDLSTPISDNLTLYAVIVKPDVNIIRIMGDEVVDLDTDGITETISFSTDKAAKYFVCTVKYSDDLMLSELIEKDFAVYKDFEENVDGYTYLYLTCTYQGEGNMPIFKSLSVFDIRFDVSENVKANDVLTVEILNDAVLSGDDVYLFEEFENAEITINSVLAQRIEINGPETISESTLFTVSFFPKNTTNKEVKWKVSDESIAVISEAGVLQPLKCGTVTVRATSKDGRNIFDEKTVYVKVYATVVDIKSNIGRWDKVYNVNENEYTIYVPETATSIRLTTSHSGDLIAEGTSQIFLSNIAKVIGLAGDKTILKLVYCCDGYEDNTYTITIIKYNGTKTEVSSDGKKFTVTPLNINEGYAIILAIFNGNNLIDVQTSICDGEDAIFTTDEDYTDAKVMVWDSLSGCMPYGDAEIIK